MPRAKRGFKRRRRVSKEKSQADGFALGRRTQYRRMIEAVRRSLVYSYIGRRLRKRDFRALWNKRISAAARLNEMSYSQLMSSMNKSNVKLNRKVLSEIAIHDPDDFSAIVKEVRA